jgi:hypothetical protein
MPITRILHFELLGFLYALAAVVVYQMLTGGINLSGMLSSKDGSGQTSPERIQLLLATLVTSATYLTEVAKNTSGTLPDISNNFLYLMGGSSGIYALRKAWKTWNRDSD